MPGTRRRWSGDAAFFQRHGQEPVWKYALVSRIGPECITRHEARDTYTGRAAGAHFLTGSNGCSTSGPAPPEQ